jgi:hypothetical protein
LRNSISFFSIELFYGFEDHECNAETDIEFASQTSWNNEIQRSAIYPICKLKSLKNEVVDPSTVVFISIPSINFAKMREVQQFTLPVCKT